VLLYSVLLGYCALFASKFPTLIPVKKRISNQRLAFVSLVWDSSILRTYLSLCTLGFHVLKWKVARALLAFCASACLPCRSQSFVVVHLCCVHTLLNTEDSSPCACVSRHRSNLKSVSENKQPHHHISIVDNVDVGSKVGSAVTDEV